jgi:RNA polymerase sigma factor (sigma-70 family)
LGVEDRLRTQVGDLFARYGREMTELAYLMTGDLHLAQDIAQEAFVRLFGRFGHVRNPDAVHAYLRKTVVNIARSHFRRRRSERAYLRRVAGDTLRGVDSDVHSLDDDTFALLQGLPPKQRAALILRFYFDLSEHQTAEILDVTSKAVNGLVTRGLNSVRERYRPDE